MGRIVEFSLVTIYIYSLIHHETLNPRLLTITAVIPSLFLGCWPLFILFSFSVLPCQIQSQYQYPSLNPNMPTYSIPTPLIPSHVPSILKIVSFLS